MPLILPSIAALFFGSWPAVITDAEKTAFETAPLCISGPSKQRCTPWKQSILEAFLAKDARAQAAQIERYRHFMQYLPRDCTLLDERWAPAATAITAKMSNAEIQAWLRTFTNQSHGKKPRSVLALVSSEAVDAMCAIAKE